MGGCLSRKKGSSSLNATTPVVSLSSMEAVVPDKLCALKGDADVNIKEKLVGEEKVKKQLVVEEEGLVKKEIFVIKHRTSHDREKLAPPQKDIGLVEENRVASALPSSTNTNPSAGDVKIGNNDSTMVMRTSSCAKEEVDAILIQCGRLSRSNSFGAGKAPSSGRKYSGHKRSYDLDHNDQDQDVEIAPASTYNPRKSNADEDNEMAADRRQHRQRHRHSGRSSPSSSSQGRRRTPSREREQRSGSRERGSGSSSSGRRVSRSPGRRSETTPTANSNGSSNANNTTTTTNRPGKMVSVPATVSSLTMDKSKNGVESQTGTAIKRISVKRNVGDSAMSNSRGAASPRSQSPVRTNAKGSNENNQQQPSLSRNSSNKAEKSPYRRNPLSEIDPNSLVYSQATENKKTVCINNNISGKVQTRNKETEGQAVMKESISVLNQAQMQKPNADINNRPVAQGTNCRGSSNTVKEAPVIVEETEVPDLKPQTLTRSRSARRSQDLAFNPETLLNPNPSYTALLLEDIQNFHQKNTTTPPSFSVPLCVTKACSILEAVADLNSTTSSNLSCAFVEDRRSPTTTGANLVGKKLTEAKDPFVESEVLVSDDIMEPSFHKYVTVRRGGKSSREDMDEQESSGSNSFVGGSLQHWGEYSTSTWEPNSTDSTDSWTSRYNTRAEDEKNLSGFQKHVVPESGRDMEEAMRGFKGQRTGIGRGRAASGKNLHSNLVVAAAAST
ncbi:hypothetical protein P3X46_016086 [Hevea brasiliensis]|uniref:DUF4005 domain-containing protein n=1 Tax=Hevea brasiliensis TaxID=3981 RepID=A0ABQ9LY21_HEVBR|nr:uncharacterized protein At1g65710 [Hevea brasiliensis]KAJ9172892.1 hypothetical protein P3X46_016086 [Hevea brasiliensis]